MECCINSWMRSAVRPYADGRVCAERDERCSPLKDFDFVQANVRTGLNLRSIDEAAIVEMRLHL